MNKNRKVIISCVAFIVLSILMILAFQYFKSSNGIERISYKNRTYIKAVNQVMDTNMKKNLDNTKPTGVYVKGLEVYDVENNPYASTVIFFKARDNNFLVYGLSGGP